MIKVFEQYKKQINASSDIIAEVWVYKERFPENNNWPINRYKAWLGRLFFEIIPIVVIVCGFFVEIYIQRLTDGVVCNILILLSVLLEIWLIWAWNYARVIEELRHSIAVPKNKLIIQAKFFGQTRLLVGESKVFLELKPRTTLRDVLVDLEQRFPVLKNESLALSSNNFKRAYVISENGSRSSVSIEAPLFVDEHLVMCTL